MTRLAVIACATLAVALLIVGLGFALFHAGVSHERTAVTIEQGEADLGQANANQAGGDAIAIAVDNHGREHARLIQEAADAGREIAAHAHEAPAAGKVGADALVDPRLAGDLLCRVKRLRADSEAAAAAACEPGRAGADPGQPT